MRSKEEIRGRMVSAVSACDVVRKLEMELRLRLEAEMREKLEASQEYKNHKAAQEELEAAQKEMSDFDDVKREHRALESLPYPLGSVLVEWAMDIFNWCAKRKPSGRKGVLEIYHKGDELPANLSFRKPSHGQLIVRLLKKDGSKSKEVVSSYSGDLFHNWFPEGVNPKE